MLGLFEYFFVLMLKFDIIFDCALDEFMLISKSLF